MKTDCTVQKFEFENLGKRDVIGTFNGGKITADGGAQLLKMVDERLGITLGLAACCIDYRNPVKIDHSVHEMISQRIYGLALGYEDLNDHDRLRSDPNLATLCGKEDPTGADRERERDKGKALAGKSTLNRMELTDPNKAEKDRYKKIVIQPDKVDVLLINIFLRSHNEIPKQIILDLDATDDLIHGNQEGKFFHGYYKNYCYLPLYIFSGDYLLCARLRSSNIDGAAGSVEELDRIVKGIRAEWPTVRIIVRGDSGFCREDIMRWCETNHFDFVLGLPKNSRLIKIIKEDMVDAEIMYRTRGRASRVYNDFQYQTLESWANPRRVVSKAEHLGKGANPRFVVTSLSGNEFEAQELYEKMYCARGEMENRIKEQQLDLFADRTSTSEMRANQVRLYYSSIAYVLMNALRQFGLVNTDHSRAQCGTIRTKLMKIEAFVQVTVRKVWLELTEIYPYKQLFSQVYENLLKMRRFIFQV